MWQPWCGVIAQGCHSEHKISLLPAPLASVGGFHPNACNMFAVPLGTGSSCQQECGKVKDYVARVVCSTSKVSKSPYSVTAASISPTKIVTHGHT